MKGTIRNLATRSMELKDVSSVGSQVVHVNVRSKWMRLQSSFETEHNNAIRTCSEKVQTIQHVKTGRYTHE